MKILFSLLFLALFFSCGERKKDEIAPPYQVPKEIKTEDGIDGISDIKEKPVAQIYWDNTLSQMGYVQNENFSIEKDDSGEDGFASFFRTITNHAPSGNYKPEYFILRKDEDNFLNWKQIGMDEMQPWKKDFYTTKGSFKDREHGPLFLIYNGNLLDAKKLTIVVSDLEEQGLNLTLLSKLIREKLRKNNDYVASIIATKLPFNGINYRTGSLDKMQNSGNINVIKPLYAIIAGPQEAVRIYMDELKRHYPEKTKDGYDSWYYANTIQQWQKPLLDISKEVKIPEEADIYELKSLIRNSKTVKDNEASGHIWNLKDRTEDQVKLLRIKIGKELKKLDKPLKMKLFEYDDVMPRSKGESKRWRLNLNFLIPSEYKGENIDVRIENYSFLTKVQKEGKKTGTSSEMFEWQKNSAIGDRNLEVKNVTLQNKKEAQIAIWPKTDGIESSVVYFDLIVSLKQKTIDVPSWVDEFDHPDRYNLNKGHDKTPNFKIFMQDLLKGDGYDEYSKSCLIRIPIMLFNMPVEKEEL